ncbi:MAG: hypothetical protein ABL956_13405 [Hyphomonadaceae bacterium]
MMLLIEKLASDGRINDREALDVRRAIFPAGAVSVGEAEALFALNERVGGDDAAWGACFIEAISDHLLFAEEPMGHVSDEGAAWLENRIGRDSVVERATELAMIRRALFAAGPSAPLERGEMLRRAKWLHTERRGGIGAFLGRALNGGRQGTMELTRKSADPQAAHVERRHVEAQVAEALETSEAAWLVTRIRADGRRTANEQALVDTVKAAKGNDQLKSA